MHEISGGSLGRADVPKLFEQSVQNILQQNSGMREEVLTYIINLILADKEISQSEIEFVYGFGNSIGLSEKEISVKFAEMIQRNYFPSPDAIV